MQWLFGAVTVEENVKEVESMRKMHKRQGNLLRSHFELHLKAGWSLS